MKHAHKKGGITRELRRALGRGEACAKCGLVMTRWIHGSDWKPTPNATHALYWDQCRGCGHTVSYRKVKIDNQLSQNRDMPTVTKLARSNRTCTRCGLAMWRWIDNRMRVTWAQCQCGNRTRSVSLPRVEQVSGPSYRVLQKERISRERRHGRVCQPC
jgi:hypothetical protein